MSEPTRTDDELLIYALQLIDEGSSLAAAARDIERPLAWLQQHVFDLFLEERASAPLH